MRRLVATSVAAASVVAAAVGGWATPAAADPPEPTDYRSRVVDVVPDSDAFTLTVVGGDSLVELRAEPGHEVVVEGYREEPYLRFEPDGTVEENASSTGAYLNGDRYDTELPAGVDLEAEPEWRTVATDGSYAWHDHRTHFMSPELPDDAVRGQVLQRWTMAVSVDGEPLVVQGEIVVERSPVWWPWLTVVAVGAAALWLTVRRWPRFRDALPSVAVGVAGTLALAVSTIEQLSFPAEAGRQVLPVVLPAIALAGTLATVVPVVRRRARLVLTLAGVATVAAWALLRFDVLTKPVLPTDLSPTLDRAATAVALALATGAAAVLLTRPRPASSEDTGSDTTAVEDFVVVS